MDKMNEALIRAVLTAVELARQVKNIQVVALANSFDVPTKYLQDVLDGKEQPSCVLLAGLIQFFSLENATAELFAIQNEEFRDLLNAQRENKCSISVTVPANDIPTMQVKIDKIKSKVDQDICYLIELI